MTEEESRYISQHDIETFVFSKASNLAPGREINNEWSYNSIPLHSLTARIMTNLALLLTKHFHVYLYKLLFLCEVPVTREAVSAFLVE